jgi:hypothetical protein
MSAVYTVYNKGARILPCGTPASMGKQSERAVP